MFPHRLLPIYLLISSASGDICFGDNAEIGACIRLANCSSAIEGLKNKIQPKICGFDGLHPIVCCTEKEKKLEEKQDEPFPPGCMKTFLDMQGKYTKVTSRIIGGGGIDSLAKEFPHMAALGYDGENGKTVWACGGTLITNNYVLTAAHCLFDRTLGEVKYVRLGDLNLNSDEDDAQPQDFKVVQRIRHPSYKPPAPYNDIAIVKLDKPCNITPYVIPACLNTKPNMSERIKYSATGWGQLGYGEKLADHLQNMIIRLFNHTECNKAYSKISKKRLSNGIDEETQFCAGAPRIDTCPGDSGGPLQSIRFHKNEVYGVTSFGVACVVSAIPGVYTRVSAYIPWIKSIILP